jgi:hypothetical protein
MYASLNSGNLVVGVVQEVNLIRKVSCGSVGLLELLWVP